MASNPAVECDKVLRQTTGNSNSLEEESWQMIGMQKSVRTRPVAVPRLKAANIVALHVKARATR
jgi:hypothetical protein